MRELILNEIRRLAAANNGQPLGRQAFQNQTGIKPHEWQGVYWARWNDAISEAGFAANEMQAPLDEELLLEQIIRACRHFGHIPTFSELRLYRSQVDRDFPSHKTIGHRFRKSELLERLKSWISGKEGFDDIAAMLPEAAKLEEGQIAKQIEGYVYLVRSGLHFKIGRSDELERRIKEIRVALPEKADLIHVIRTDDPAGIEAYWHRRFADRRANGEWFKLKPADIAAFKRRKYQ